MAWTPTSWKPIRKRTNASHAADRPLAGMLASNLKMRHMTVLKKTTLLPKGGRHAKTSVRAANLGVGVPQWVRNASILQRGLVQGNQPGSAIGRFQRDLRSHFAILCTICTAKKRTRLGQRCGEPCVASTKGDRRWATNVQAGQFLSDPSRKKAHRQISRRMAR